MRWLKRLFGRSQKRQVVLRLPPPTSWAAGDMAGCVRDDWQPVHLRERGPRRGDKAMVLEVILGPINGAPDRIDWGLRLTGYSGYWVASAFRKLTLTDAGLDRRVARETPAAPAPRQPAELPA